MRKFLLFVLLIFPFLLSAEEKSDYDLDFRGLSKLSSASPEYLMKGNDSIEISLTKEGYYTLGTVKGISESILDDQCQITYGHPYAMTSFPVMAVDGEWCRIPDYVNEPASLGLREDAGSLVLNGMNENGLTLQFILRPLAETASVEFVFSLTNTDSVSHTVQPGFVLDPALGKWGDGVALINGSAVLRDTMINYSQLPGHVQVWEKNKGAAGLGTELKFAAAEPEMIVFANWHDMHDNISPAFEQSYLRDLYDLVIQVYWPETELQAGSQTEIQWQLDLLDPDFSSPVFTRWDLPSFISMTNGIMFPDDFVLNIETMNVSGQSLNNLKLITETPEIFNSEIENSTFSLDIDDKSNVSVNLSSKIIYENTIAEVSAHIYENELLRESISRMVFVPGTPLSDTGLVVVNDSLSTADFPEVQLLFSTEYESTGQRVLNLGAENIFLYENDARIRDFNFGKFTEGGTEQADIVFVLDVTGSMGGEIDEVKNNLVEFTDSLSIQGVDFRLAMVTFLDVIENVYDFTSDVQLFQGYINAQHAHGGGDGAENSLDALMTATQFEFRPRAKRVFIWITDANYHQNDWATDLVPTDVVEELLTNAITVHCVGTSAFVSDYYNDIILPVGGNFYDINGNFRDILLDISRFEVQDRYKISFMSNSHAGQNNQLKLELHYGGRGVIKTYEFTTDMINKASSKLVCYPNPFNPQVTLQVYKTPGITGELSIYNILGQRVQQYKIPGDAAHAIIWNGLNSSGMQVGSGYYIVQLNLHNTDGSADNHSTRILYLK